MKRVPISTSKLTFVLLLIVLPLSALVCNQSPPRVQEQAAATPSPSPSPSPLTSAGGKYVLEVLFQGFISVTHSTITYGPNTATVDLENKQGTHEGSYEGIFDAKMTGECTGSGTFPVTYDVTAKEVKVGNQDELDFSVKETQGAMAAVSCWGGSGGVTEPTKTNTYTFTLPLEDGASKTYSIPPGYVTLTFTLRKQGP
jgi:hypothetical protein